MRLASCGGGASSPRAWPSTCLPQTIVYLVISRTSGLRASRNQFPTSVQLPDEREDIRLGKPFWLLNAWFFDTSAVVDYRFLEIEMNLKHHAPTIESLLAEAIALSPDEKISEYLGT